MFLGHFAVGFAAKRAAPRASLPVLLVAPQFLDVLWPIFNLAGIEHTRIQPGFTAASPLVLEYMPYSHSLVAALGWSVAFAAVYAAFKRDARTSIVLGMCVISHWVLDWIAHTPDMPLLHGDGPRYGLGLWNSIPGTLAVEIAMLIGGALLYARATRPRDRVGSIGLGTLVAVLIAMQLATIFGPPPPDPRALFVVAIGAYSLLIAAWWIDRHRETV